MTTVTLIPVIMVACVRSTAKTSVVPVRRGGLESRVKVSSLEYFLTVDNTWTIVGTDTRTTVTGCLHGRNEMQAVHEGKG